MATRRSRSPVIFAIGSSLDQSDCTLEHAISDALDVELVEAAGTLLR
jgi:hypothetical protein